MMTPTRSACASGGFAALRRPAILAALLVFGIAVLAPPARPVQGKSSGNEGLRERIERLAGDDETARKEMESLPRLGEEVSLAALSDLASRGLLERRRRAHLVYQAGGARSIGPAISALGDPDAGTRGELLAFLGRADLGVSGLAERVDALAARALGDPELGLRGRAIELLAGLDRPESLSRLDSILDEIESPLRGRAAALLAERPEARKIVEGRIRAAEGRLGDGRAADADILGPLLAAFGRILAEWGDAKAMGPILAARLHPDPAVRRGARFGLETFLRRLLGGAAAASACAAVEDLEPLGLDPTEGAIFRARITLILGKDSAPALEAAREIVRASPATGGRDSRSARAIGFHLEAAARLAAGSAEDARGPLEEEARLLDGLLAERLDRQAASLAREHSVWLHRRAQCELFEIVRTLAKDSPGAENRPGAPQPPSEDLLTDPASIVRCLEAARRVHALELEAQLADALAGATAVTSLDPLLDDELSPTALLLENPRLPAWPAPRALAMRTALGRLLASVAHDEMPGFEPLPGLELRLADPLSDPERADRLRRILRARLDEVSSAFLNLRERVRREMAGNPAAPSDDDAERIQVLNRQKLDLLDTNQRAGQGEPRAMLESRAPSLHGMALVRALREEGLAARARTLALAVKADLERSGDLKRFWLFEADIEMAIGSTWIDDDDPVRAEVEITRAVERLETIEDALKERGASPRDLAGVRALRSGALVSLAVNANVKMGNPERALAYFERAFELRQDEFMRVLLACYRARSGRSEEARAILREIAPSPADLYNVACTWALLGEKELALDCLKRNFELSPMSSGALDKQKEWARKDPDLSSLRDDPRFRALVGG